MELGERITVLRRQRGMSQGDLAEALGVSRQSVSKWETAVSVPELDKLVKLAGVFGVTLDELAVGEGEAEAAGPEKGKLDAGPWERRAVGVFCLCSALILALVSLGYWYWKGLLVALPFLMWGLIALLSPRNWWLWEGWALFLTADGYFRMYTSWRVIVRTFRWSEELGYARLVFGWGQFLCGMGLLLWTLWYLRKYGKRSGGSRWKLALGAVGFLLLRLPYGRWLRQTGVWELMGVIGVVEWIQDGVSLALFRPWVCR